MKAGASFSEFVPRGLLKLRNSIKDSRGDQKKPVLSRGAIIRLFSLVAVTAVLLVVYRFFINSPYHIFLFWGYTLILSVLTVIYVVYNRGMSRKGVTKDMLPDDWDDEEKDRFIEDGKKRLEKSKWMLIFIFAFVVVFAFDAMELFVFPMFEGLLS